MLALLNADVVAKRKVDGIQELPHPLTVKLNRAVNMYSTQ